jgi:lipopolysaccharide export system permease protein
MKIIQRHYVSEFFKILSIIAFGLALIFSLLDLIDKIDDFMPSKPSLLKLVLYALLNFPKYLYFLLPISVLICSLFVFSQASRNKELIAIKATGGRLKRLFFPFIILGMLLSMADFLIGEFIVPDFSERTNELKDDIKQKEKKLSFKEGTLWMRGTDGSLVRIELYVPDKKFAKNISIFRTKDSMLTERIEAEDAQWIQATGSPGIWKMKNVTIYDIGKGEVRTVPEMDYPYLESPDLFAEKIKKPEEMGIIELYKYTQRLKAVGFKNTKLVVDMNSKISYPVANFFLILLGLAFTVSGRIGGGLVATGLGIFISFIYWLGYTFMLSLGYAGIVPPVVSAWFIPSAFGAFALYLFHKIPE